MSNKLLENEDKELYLSSLISYLAVENPSIERLDREQIKVIANGYLFDELKNQLRNRVDIEKIDIEKKINTYLERHDKRSLATGKTYRNALNELKEWALREGIHILEMKYKDADTFISSLNGSSSTIRTKISACSSFFSFLERETNNKITNPFRGTKIRPAKKTKIPIVPSIEEVDIIANMLDKYNKIAVYMMLDCGLRVGSLQSLTLIQKRYTAVSKGKRITGKVSDRVIQMMKEYGVSTSNPFGSVGEDTIRNAFKYAVSKLFKAGMIKSKYSVHDLRHLFAITEYKKDKDIYRLKTLLNHSTIAITESYLKGLDIYL